jgi:hypothetical protein
MSSSIEYCAGGAAAATNIANAFQETAEPGSCSVLPQSRFAEACGVERRTRALAACGS